MVLKTMDMDEFASKSTRGEREGFSVRPQEYPNLIAD